jgi:hypothetical protein
MYQPFKGRWLLYVPPALILKPLRYAYTVFSVHCVALGINGDHFSNDSYNGLVFCEVGTDVLFI